LTPGNYFGLITGPNESHGGYYPNERPFVREIQQALIRKGFVPGITDPGSGWADGKYEQPTREAVLRFQAAIGYVRTGNIWPDDWARLLA
jgi:peptidoglycan hydrolase-like protein with peptidoglycan-binding domain